MEKIVSILNNYHRNMKEVQLLEQYFSFHFSYISVLESKLDRQFYLQIFQSLEIEVIKENVAIFEAGEIGKKMYFILEGEVGILLPKSKDSLRTAVICDNFQESVDQTYCDFKLVVCLKAGQHFGEIALQNKVPRTATVLTKTKVTAATLSYRMYQEIVRMAYIQINQKKMDFLKALPLFDEWPEAALSILMRYLVEHEYPAFSYIYKEKSAIDDLYLIINGVVKVQVISYTSTSPLLAKKVKQIHSSTQLSSSQHFGEYEIFHFHELIDKVGDLNAKLKQFSRTTQAITLTQTKLYKLDIYQFIENCHIFSDIEKAKYNFNRTYLQRSLMQAFRSKVIQESLQQSVTYRQIIKRDDSSPIKGDISSRRAKVTESYLQIIPKDDTQHPQPNSIGILNPQRLKKIFSKVKERLYTDIEEIEDKEPQRPKIFRRSQSQIKIPPPEIPISVKVKNGLIDKSNYSSHQIHSNSYITRLKHLIKYQPQQEEIHQQSIICTKIRFNKIRQRRGSQLSRV